MRGPLIGPWLDYFKSIEKILEGRATIPFCPFCVQIGRFNQLWPSTDGKFPSSHSSCLVTTSSFSPSAILTSVLPRHSVPLPLLVLIMLWFFLTMCAGPYLVCCDCEYHNKLNEKDHRAEIQKPKPSASVESTNAKGVAEGESVAQPKADETSHKPAKVIHKVPNHYTVKGFKLKSVHYPWTRPFEQNPKYFISQAPTVNLRKEVLTRDDPDPLKKEEFRYIEEKIATYIDYDEPYSLWRDIEKIEVLKNDVLEKRFEETFNRFLGNMYYGKTHLRPDASEDEERQKLVQKQVAQFETSPYRLSCGNEVNLVMAWKGCKDDATYSVIGEDGHPDRHWKVTTWEDPPEVHMKAMAEKESTKQKSAREKTARGTPTHFPQ